MEQSICLLNIDLSSINKIIYILSFYLANFSYLFRFINWFSNNKVYSIANNALQCYQKTKKAYWSTSWKNIFHMCRKDRRSIAVLLWNTFANGNFQVKVKCTFYMFHFLKMMDSTNELAFKNLWPVKILQECLVFFFSNFLHCSIWLLLKFKVFSIFHCSSSTEH